MKNFYIKTLAIATALLLNLTLQARADDLYDGLYDRPTHFPDFSQPTDWPTTMSYFVCVRINNNDKRLHNYEVAVYDQKGNMRQCGRSITAQKELCTLTIPGEAGDTLHFKVIYGSFDKPTISDVSETCRFVTNDNVGTLDNPFWLTMPLSTGIHDINAKKEDKDAIYTISGTRVKAIIKPGIYIKNGKKIVKR